MVEQSFDTVDLAIVLLLPLVSEGNGRGGVVLLREQFRSRGKRKQQQSEAEESSAKA
jgi:hypothetical protein